MSKACNWIKDSKGNTTGAKINGTEQRSKLFDDLNEEFGIDKAMELFAVSNSDSFLDVFGGNNNKINDEQSSTKYRNRGRWNESRGSQTLEGAPIIQGATGADIRLTAVAEQYAIDKGISYRRQSKYVEVDVELSTRVAQAYEDMEHKPQDPKVKEAYQNLIQQTKEQYQYLVDAGYQFYFYDETNDPYEGNPFNAMRDLRNNKQMAVFATEGGYGGEETGANVDDNPMLEDTGLNWGWGALGGESRKVYANDLFRAVHDAFGHGLEGAGFRARGEENAWQAHARLFTGSAVGAITSETRGQNSWLNYGKFGETNMTAKIEDTVFAEQKTGLMPEWTWKLGFNEGTLPAISPETSLNYANLTEDGQGNFVFYHRGNSGYKTIKKSSGGTLATSREENQALAKVGGLAMYYSRPEDGESMVKGESKYRVKVPMPKVYDFNTDSLNLVEKAKKLHAKENPNKAFDANTQVAYITKLASELGYDMVVAQWEGKTRAQSFKELVPEDSQELEGSTIVKDFKTSYKSNTEKGWTTVLPQSKEAILKGVYDKIVASVGNNYSNPLYKIGEMSYYSFEDSFAPFKTQEQVTKLIEESELSEEIKNEYSKALLIPDRGGYSTKIEEPTKQTLINYVVNENKTEEKLSQEQLVDLQDCLLYTLTLPTKRIV